MKEGVLEGEDLILPILESFHSLCDFLIFGMQFDTKLLASK